jgi:hypothetical protein
MSTTQEESKTLSAEEAKLYVGTKTDYYNAMLLNDYFMMTLKSSGCTIAYMDSVRAGKFWVPKFTTLKMRGCPYAPTKEHFYQEIISILKERNLDYGVKSHQACDAFFLQVCLSTLNPKHRYFAKDFLPKVLESKHARPPTTVVDNSDDFYTGLPTKKINTKLKTTSEKKHESSPTTSSSTSGFKIGGGSSFKSTPGSYQSPQPQQMSKSGTPEHDVSMEFGS